MSTGCAPTPPVAKTSEVKAEGAGPPGAAKAAEPVLPITVGDVEARIHMDATVDAAARGPNMAVEELEDYRQGFNYVTITVSPPYPAQLAITFKTVPHIGFAEQPYVLRTTVFRDKNVIATFNNVIVSDPPASELAPPSRVNVFNVLEGLTATPDTLLVRAQSEIVLYPKGTDAATIDPKAPAPGTGPTGVLLSNPVRITFAHGGNPS
jgi:hypothetical protein